MELNEKLSKLRKEKGYSQEKLSNKLQVSRQTISKWENGFAVPDSENLINIANFFNININELISDDAVSNVLENVKKEKSKKNIKNFMVLIFILIIILIIIFLCNIGRRYMIIDSISKRFTYIFLQDNDTFFFSKSVNFIDTVTLERMHNYEKDYCYKDVLKKEYYKTYFDINLKNNNINLDRIEYRDNSNYYDINIIDRNYIITPYDQGTSMFYNFTSSQLDARIRSEFNNMYSVKEKLLLALNFNCNITVLKGAEEKDEYYYLNKDDEDNKRTITLQTPIQKDEYYLSLEVQEYNEEKTQITTTKYYFSSYIKDLEENIKLINLSDFNKID